MSDAVVRLAGEMARVFSAFNLPHTAADALRSAVSHWRVNTTAVMPQPAASLRRRLDEFFNPQREVNPLGAAMNDWRRLPWRAGGGGKAPDICVVEIVGPDGIAACDECRAGALFQSAGYFYPWHRHAAEEFYVPVSGTATWMAEGREPAAVASMKELIHHHSWQPHAVRTDDEPLLALWLWTGDLSIGQYELCSPPDMRGSAQC